MKQTSSSSYRSEIDGLRFIAITVVLFFHLGFSDWAGGFTGVDIFFVLSGYLICGQIYISLCENRFSTLDFFARRIRRLSTAAFACFLVTGGTAYVVFSPFELDAVVRNLLGSITFTNNILLMNEAGYFAPSAATNPFLHTWSLSIEEQFYIALPLAIACLNFRAGNFVLLLSVAFIVSLSITLLSGSAIYSQDARYFSSLLRVWQLALGGLTFVALQNMSHPIKLFGLPLIGLVMMVAPTFVMQEGAVHPGPWALVATFGTALMLLSAFPAHSVTARVLSSRVPRYLGKISYGTYLWHWPIIVFYQYVGGNFNDKTRVLAIFLSFAMGALSHHVIEQPVRKISTSRKRGLLFGLFAAQTLVLAGLAGALWIRGNNTDAAEYAKFVKVQENGKIANEKWDLCWYQNSGDDLCVFGELNSEQRPILLWGDSMANSALPAFEALAELRQTSGAIYAKPSCPPLFGVVRDVSNASTCLEMNSLVLEILKSARPTDVYLFARWPHYAEGVHSNMWGDLGKVGFLDVMSNPVDAETITVFAGALNALLAEIDPRHRVIIIGAPPEFPYSVPNEMIKKIRFEQPLEQLARSRYESRAGRTNSLLSKLSQTNDVTLLNLTEVFCSPEVCHMSEDGIPLFADHVHLSARGNEVLLDSLENH
jgi:peptidoglycan/LPS O-acetylase OafA/YrhL